MGPYDPTQEGDDAYRYQLAYMAYILGLVQYHHTPAYRELWRDTLRRLIEKMMRWEVWGYWELTSRGSKLLDPDLTKLGDGWIDPVIRQNVMYSGHLLMMVGLYEMLYRDGRFDQDGALTFQFRPVFRGLGPQDFPYDHSKLATSIYAEFERNNFLGCECEPNAIFVYCNQFPMLGFKHFDLTHGTEFAGRAMPKFRQAWMKRSTMFQNDPTAELPIFYRLRQDDFIYEQSEENNEGITAVAWASIMHAWAKDYVELVYPRARDRIIQKAADGALCVNMKHYAETHAEYARTPVEELAADKLMADPMMLGVHIFGTLALAAAEVGDRETVDGLLAFAEANMTPTWKNGGYFYKRNDDLSSAAYITALTGNALLAGARLCPTNGFYDLYNNPWRQEEINRPTLCEVLYPDIEVLSADYENGADIQFVLAPADAKDSVQEVAIAGLDLSRPMTIRFDNDDAIIVSSEKPERISEEGTAWIDRAVGKAKVQIRINRARKIAIRSQ